MERKLMIFPDRIKIVVASWLIILATCWGYSENLMPNSGFELGSAGYHCLKYLRQDTNPKLTYEGPVADASTFVSGEQSLKIPNRFAEAVYFFTDPAKSKPETAYTLSVWLKSSVDNYPVMLIAKSSTRWVTFGTLKVNVGKKWTRYVLNFKTDKQDDFLKFCLLAGKENVPCGIWLDDLSVTENKEMKAGGPVEVEGYVAIDKLYIRNDKFKEAPASLKVINNLSKKINLKLGVNVADRYTGENVFRKDMSIELLPKERKSIDFTLPLANGGYVIMPFTDDNVKSKFIPSLFAIAGEYNQQPVDINKTFCIGLNAVPTSVELPFWAHVLGEKVAPGIQVSSPVSEKFELMEKMGCRLFRLWEAGNIRWSEIESKEGKFNFTSIDRMLNLTEKYGISVLLVLGNMDFVDINTGKQYFAGSLPEWLKGKCSIREKFPMKRKYTKGRVYLPPMASWEKYVGEIIRHCRGRVFHYEIMNEPNLIFSNPNEYTDYAKAAWEVLKKYDKTAKLLGPGVTGDLGGSPASFLGKYIAGGGLKYVDIVSFHPYNARELSSLIPADKQIEEFKTLCENAGGKKYPLWNTELYYLFGPDGSSLSDAKLSQAHHSARRILTDLGEGVKQSIAQPLWAIWDSKLHPGQMEYPHLEQIPSSTYVTLNTLARFFEGAKPIDKRRWLDRVICYVYEQRDGNYIAAFWNYREKNGDNILLQLPDNAGNLELFDMFGNKQQFNGRSLKIGVAPIYIRWNNGGADAVRAVINHVTVSNR